MARRAHIAGVLVVAAAVVALPAAASARTKLVFADAPPSAQRLLHRYGASVNDFFRHTVTINQGDSVKFLSEGFHTIDLPGHSRVDLPLVVPGGPLSGVRDAAGRLFWFNGHVPSLGINPSLFQASGPAHYDGSQRVDSGLPLGGGPPKPFEVAFTRPGTYKYFCDVHPGMVGYVVVRARGQRVPSARDDSAALAKQVKADEAVAATLARTRVKGNRILLGQSSPGGVEDYAVFPHSLRIRPGTVVSFSMSPHSREVHTASFGPSQYLQAIADSLVSPAPEQQGWYPSDIPSTEPFPLAPTSHGDGFVSTGLLDTDPSTTTISASGRIRFTRAGVYHFICLIHPFMKGTIVVR